MSIGHSKNETISFLVKHCIFPFALVSKNRKSTYAFYYQEVPLAVHFGQDFLKFQSNCGAHITKQHAA